MKTSTIASEVKFVREKSAPIALNVPALFGTTWDELQFNYYSVIVFTLVAGSCVGGAAAAFALHNGAPIWQLSIVAAVSLFNNTTAIGNMPIKWVVWSFIGALLVNTSFILLNLF